MWENTEGALNNGQSRETGNIGYTKRRQSKQKHNTIGVGHHYTHTNTNNVMIMNCEKEIVCLPFLVHNAQYMFNLSTLYFVF